jgi:NIPSNAP protein
MTVAATVLPVFGQAEKASRDTVFELRQYTLYGGKRDTLIALFEKNFIESQEAVGANVIGTFRDLDDPDRFVWIRGFRDMQARAEALDSFYGSSPAWLAHKKEANVTMVDSDNVLLLRPASSQPKVPGTASLAPGDNAIYAVTIYYLAGVEEAQFTAFFDSTILPHVHSLGVQPVAVLTTDEVPNNYPRLPIRERDRVFLWISRFPNEDAYGSFAAQMRRWSGWRDKAPEAVLPAVMRKPEQLRLKPTTRSPMQ